VADSPELKEEQLSRNRQFFGEAGQKNVMDAFVVVVGAGGVGSHAVHMLARAGVGCIRVVDFDNVTLSSLNRHATATRADVGTPKVVAMARALAQICPFVTVEPVVEMFKGSAAARLLAPNAAGRVPDCVLDCIDDTETKADLLVYCKQNNLRVLSSLGAAGKADPTRLHISDLSLVRRDPLGIALRQQLRKLGLLPRGSDETNITLTGVPCVYSSELPRVKLLPLDLDESKGEKPEDFGAVPGMRVRVLAVVGTMPAMFGQTMATWALCELAGPEHKLQPSEAIQLSYNSAFKMQSRFALFDGNTYPRSPGMGAGGSLTLDEVAFVTEETWHQRSPVSAVRVGTRAVNLQLCRWRPWAGCLPSNTVLLVDDEAAALTKACMTQELLQLARVVGDLEAIAHGRGQDRRKLTAEEAAMLGESRAALEAGFRAAALSVVGSEEVFQTIEHRLAWTKAQGWS
jgi:tRNA A37 threonylcarbamoyladenosine dehydratase